MKPAKGMARHLAHEMNAPLATDLSFLYAGPIALHR